MRLSKNEISVIKNRLQELSPEAKVYLFGSRVDDNKIGGDIDLLVVSNKLTKRDMREIRIEFFNHFEEQKVDIVLDDGKFQDPFSKHILKKAVQL